jgi:hypothetical protein
MEKQIELIPSTKSVLRKLAGRKETRSAVAFAAVAAAYSSTNSRNATK